MASALLDPRNTHFILVCESTVPLFTFDFTYEFSTSEPRGFPYRLYQPPLSLYPPPSLCLPCTAAEPVGNDYNRGRGEEADG